MRDDFEKLLQQEMKNSEFQKEWNALEPEFNIIQAMVDARKKSHLTQKELAQKTGINQADISNLKTEMQILLFPFCKDLPRVWICN